MQWLHFLCHALGHWYTMLGESCYICFSPPPSSLHPVLHPSPPPASNTLLSFRSPATVNLNLPAFDLSLSASLPSSRSYYRGLEVTQQQMWNCTSWCWIEQISVFFWFNVATDWTVVVFGQCDTESKLWNTSATRQTEDKTMAADSILLFTVNSSTPHQTTVTV